MLVRRIRETYRGRPSCCNRSPCDLPGCLRYDHPYRIGTVSELPQISKALALGLPRGKASSLVRASPGAASVVWQPVKSTRPQTEPGTTCVWIERAFSYYGEVLTRNRTGIDFGTLPSAKLAEIQTK